MKLAVAFAAVLVCALAAPLEDKDATVVKHSADSDPQGNFHSSYETSNGIQSQETGEAKQGVDQENKPFQYVVRSGRYTYVDPEGNSHSVTWRADENGYNAQSADIPVAPAPQPN